ncbi:uncharacterized protein LOC131168621 isoform X2 [Malania oleifera]|uniref:uncharacterized protein LOC131168621 isoform X2 n=1 Tax=Malania oleifera TaxID=397392 RepID=UPI0025ADE990|nr:uncharacterized protein LOC131168621 isoform X2 [Malania oleifera]
MRAAMELKHSTIIVIFLLFLPLQTCFSKAGGMDVAGEVYVIDYRGPETHSNIPPPSRGRSRSRRPFVPRAAAAGGGGGISRTISHPNSKGLKAAHVAVGKGN